MGEGDRQIGGPAEAVCQHRGGPVGHGCTCTVAIVFCS